MSILAPCAVLFLFILAVVDICIQLDNQRLNRLAWKQGWAARGRRALQWLRNPEKP